MDLAAPMEGGDNTLLFAAIFAFVAFILELLFSLNT